MCSMLCPLCSQSTFTSIDALRCSLIKAANGPLECPICHELFLGLDKLTIHLFSHTNIMNSQTESTAAATSASSSSASPSPSANIKQNSLRVTTPATNPIKNIETTTNGFLLKQNQIKNELNFENIHHGNEQEKTIKKPKVLNNNQCQFTTPPAQHYQNNQQVVELQSTEHLQPAVESLATCDICEFNFRNEELRNMHVRLVHQNFTFSNDSIPALTDHSATATVVSNREPDFKCHLCSKTFKMKGSLRVHLKVVHLMGLPHGNSNSSQKLTICDRIRHKEGKNSKLTMAKETLIASSTNISSCPDISNNLLPSTQQNSFNIPPLALLASATNVTPAHIENTNIIAIPNNKNQLPKSELNPGMPQNVLLIFNTPPSLASLDNKQISLCSRENEINPSLITTKYNTTLPAANDNPKIWECDVCSKSFTTKYFLKKHKRLHTGEMPYTCEICARTFTFQQSYHKHLLYHSDEKPHQCSTCGRAFKELSTLHNHERIHSGEKPFQCEVCNKSFRQRVSFLVHTRIHTGVMPYKCELCQKSFRYKVSQRTHKCQSSSMNSVEENSSSPAPAAGPMQSTASSSAFDQLSENFIKAFLENSANSPATNGSCTVNNQSAAKSIIDQSQNSPCSSEIAALTEKSSSSCLDEHQALLSKCIDDIVVESCNKLGIGNNANGSSNRNEHAFPNVVQNVNEGSMSPSQKLQNLRLYTPELCSPELNGIDGELTRFLLETSENGSNLL